MNNRKAQVNLEFLAAAGFFLLALGSIITASSGFLPSYSQNSKKSSLNLEARSLTNKMITEPGSHSYTGGGNDWESNPDTVKNIESFGIASDFLKVERDKINALSTVSRTGDKLNYSVFKQLTGAENQYRFKFIWMPTVHTHQSFTRGTPPSDPSITEPDVDIYQSADNEVHYGSVTLNGQNYKFLVTAHDDVYNASYVSDDWDFRDNGPYSTHESISPASFTVPFTVHSFQNRKRDPGSLMVLNQTLKTFGAGIDSDSTVIKMERFAEMENEPLKIEVWAW